MEKIFMPKKIIDKNPINIFSSDNTDDLPEKCKEQLRKKRDGTTSQKVLKLFDLKRVLTINEIIIALYRKHKTVKERGPLSNILHYLNKRNAIKKIGVGTYEKC
jgi:hypothetical protein